MKQTWLTKLLTNLFGKNVWGWLHLTTSAVLCSVYYRLFPHQWNWETLKWGVGIVFGLALFWEAIEFIFEIGMRGLKVEDVYGTKKHYLQDTLGDILLAILGWGIAII